MRRRCRLVDRTRLRIRAARQDRDRARAPASQIDAEAAPAQVRDQPGVAGQRVLDHPPARRHFGLGLAQPVEVEPMHDHRAVAVVDEDHPRRLVARHRGDLALLEAAEAAGPARHRQAAGHLRGRRCHHRCRGGAGLLEAAHRLGAAGQRHPVTPTAGNADIQRFAADHAGPDRIVGRQRHHRLGLAGLVVGARPAPGIAARHVAGRQLDGNLLVLDERIRGRGELHLDPVGAAPAAGPQRPVVGLAQAVDQLQLVAAEILDIPVAPLEQRQPLRHAGLALQRLGVARRLGVAGFDVPGLVGAGRCRGLVLPRLRILGRSCRRRLAGGGLRLVAAAAQAVLAARIDGRTPHAAGPRRRARPGARRHGLAYAAPAGIGLPGGGALGGHRHLPVAADVDVVVQDPPVGEHQPQRAAAVDLPVVLGIALHFHEDARFRPAAHLHRLAVHLHFADCGVVVGLDHHQTALHARGRAAARRLAASLRMGRQRRQRGREQQRQACGKDSQTPGCGQAAGRGQVENGAKLVHRQVRVLRNRRECAIQRRTVARVFDRSKTAQPRRGAVANRVAMRVSRDYPPGFMTRVARAAGQRA